VRNAGVPVGLGEYYWDGSDYRLFSVTRSSHGTVRHTFCVFSDPFGGLRDLVTHKRYGLGELS
jgi:hypothetical protein